MSPALDADALMYDLQKAFEEVKSRTSHLKNTVIAVMGCIVNGSGDMADADGDMSAKATKVTIYKRKDSRAEAYSGHGSRGSISSN